MKAIAGVSALVGFVSLISFAGVGCSSEADPTPKARTPETTDTNTNTDTTETCEAELEGDCGTCMKGACCDALTECEGDADCAACVQAKDSDACERTPETHARVDAFLTCKGGACADSCIATEAGSCKGLVDDIVPQKCTECLQESCCDEVTACHGADVCWDGCFQNHDESKCHGDPDAHALYHAMGACVSKHCSKECE